jgi:hypothetical protein
MNERYVMANIKLPIRIHSNGSTEPLTDYISFLLEPCDKLPDNISPSNVQTEFIENLKRLLPPSEPVDKVVDRPNALIITPQELHARPAKSSSHNTSFKNKRASYMRYTVKNRSSS